ncbi:hypothetical protein ANO11243_016770 [Dothideomycetidae sp. 11243]|nr:hypothetical protein ANO11243_016770 [fungal sp. No.11243]
MPNTVWASDRLVYRAIEKDDADWFQYELGGHENDFLNSSDFLPVPQGSKQAIGSVEWLQGCLLGVLICLPAAETDTTTITASDSATGTADKPSGPRKKPTPIGFIGMSNAPPDRQQHRHTMIGITMMNKYQNKGYGTEAIKWSLNWAFRYGNMHRVEIGALALNTGAVRLYERLGFTLESRKREHVWFDGRYADIVELAMLEREWRERYGKDLLA